MYFIQITHIYNVISFSIYKILCIIFLFHVDSKYTDCKLSHMELIDFQHKATPRKLISVKMILSLRESFRNSIKDTILR